MLFNTQSMLPWQKASQLLGSNIISEMMGNKTSHWAQEQLLSLSTSERQAMQQKQSWTFEDSNIPSHKLKNADSNNKKRNEQENHCCEGLVMECKEELTADYSMNQSPL